MVAVLSGCVRRTMTITSAPAGALVFLNDQEAGRTKMTTDFLWYGDYDVVLRKKGYQTLKTHWDIKAPWYERMPFDFFAEVLWPGHLHDQHVRHYELAPAVEPSPSEVAKRALELQAHADGTKTGLGDSLEGKR